MKVGDYVRTKDGQLFRWDRWFTTDKSKDSFESAYIFIDINSIIKSSQNIIDLIEVGDYVDKLRVVDKYENYIVIETFDERIPIYKGEPIKSIVTKEQFSQMEYRIGE